MSDISEYNPDHHPLINREIIFEGPRLAVSLLVMIVVFCLAVEIPFHLIWTKDDVPLVQFHLPAWAKFLSLIAAIFLHEMIHGVIFATYAPRGFKAIRFGFSTSLGSPYCHCEDPVKIKHYRRAGIAPFIVLGLLPLIFGLVTGEPWCKTFGLLLSLGGFGDLFVWFHLLKYNGNLMILDHPEKMGFFVE
jgi:hypothetical protein